jgi:hypothetical protein
VLRLILAVTVNLTLTRSNLAGIPNNNIKATFLLLKHGGAVAMFLLAVAVSLTLTRPNLAAIAIQTKTTALCIKVRTTVARVLMLEVTMDVDQGVRVVMKENVQGLENEEMTTVRDEEDAVRVVRVAITSLVLVVIMVVVVVLVVGEAAVATPLVVAVYTLY